MLTRPTYMIACASPDGRELFSRWQDQTSDRALVTKPCPGVLQALHAERLWKNEKFMLAVKFLN